MKYKKLFKCIIAVTILYSIALLPLGHARELFQKKLDDEGNLANVPEDVAEIVKAISQVQKDVTKFPNNENNIKVATGNSPVDRLNSQQENDKNTVLFALPSASKPLKTKPQSEEISNSVNEFTAVENDENATVPSYSSLTPPTSSIFSYDGLLDWFRWVVSMRDPQINPEGAASWRNIIRTGIFGLIQQHNPFRINWGRALETDSANGLLAVYKNRLKVIEALKTNKIQPDSQSILEYAANVDDEEPTNSSKKIVALEKVNQELSTADKSKIGNIPGVLQALIDVLNGEPLTAVTDALTAPVTPKPILSAPWDVKLVNIALKAFYILIPLIFIPWSGIENFFLAPLPPNLDTVPGVLRLLGIQAVLGPDYVLDYDAAYDPAYDAPEELVEEILAEEGSEKTEVQVPPPDDFDDYDYSDDKRRLDTTKKKKKKKKVEKHEEKKKVDPADSSYSVVPDVQKPPPSRYGVSSYTSYKNEAARIK